uniref:RING-type E3 ubiquitin transferase n=1 Tax=Tanacetum cinerariifolium TaxID=118510 RepID=A0A6L2KAF0_TANCI|nr:U-box domain-containing protein 15 [Tanacetum cinerariifolium]
MMEEENVLSNARVVRDVAEELIGIIEGVKSMGEIRGTQKKECQNLVRRLRQCLPLMEELRDLDAHIPEVCISCLRKLKKAFILAKKLLKTCHAGSKIYLILEADAMVTRFHTVYDKLNHAMDGFPYKEIGISEEVNEQVGYERRGLFVVFHILTDLTVRSTYSTVITILTSNLGHVRYVLTQEALDAFCNTFHIPVEVHHILPNQDDTMHERPARKIWLYTRFFNFANFRVGLFRWFYVNSKKSGWMSFSKRLDNAADPVPMAADFNAQDYATLVAHPSPLWKFSEAFLCLVGLSCHYTLVDETFPQFVHKNGEGGVVKRERDVNEPRLLDTTVGRIVPLLSVALNRADSELEASVERLFNEGGSGNQTEQGDSARGGPDADIQPFVKAVNIVTEDAVTVHLRRQGKRKSVAVDAGGASHLPKKLKEDHGTPSGTSIGGKSRSPLQKLLAGAVLNAKVGVTSIPTLPIVTASVSTTPEREDEDIRTSSSTLVMTTATTVTSTVDSTLVAKEKPIKPSLFVVDSSSTGGADPNTGVFSDLTGSNFLVGGIRTVIGPDTDLQKVYVPQWSVTNGSRLDDGRVCHEMVDEFAPPKFFTSVRGMKHDQLFTKFNVRAARQMSLSAEIGCVLSTMAKAAKAIRLRAQTSNLKDLEKSLQGEVNALKGRNIILENDSLTDQVYKLEVSFAELQEKIIVYDNCMEKLEKFQDDRMKVVNDELAKLDLDLAEMAWAAISRAIEKGMQSGLATGIDHGREGRSLADVAAYNPDAKVDFNTVVQELRDVDFPLLVELKSYKDASSEDIMNVLRLEGVVADAPRMNDLQPDIEQMKVPIYRYEDQVALVGVWTSLLEPLSVTSLMGEASTSGVVPTASVTTTALSTTFASASFIPPISTDDYEIVRESCFPSRSLNLYAPFPTAFVTSYGPSHLGPSFPVSFARLASLLRYTRASSFCTGSTSAVLIVGMPISIGMTSSVSYVNENEVSSLLDFIMVRLGMLLLVTLRPYAW